MGPPAGGQDRGHDTLVGYATHNHSLLSLECISHIFAEEPLLRLHCAQVQDRGGCSVGAIVEMHIVSILNVVPLSVALGLMMVHFFLTFFRLWLSSCGHSLGRSWSRPVCQSGSTGDRGCQHHLVPCGALPLPAAHCVFRFGNISFRVSFFGQLPIGVVDIALANILSPLNRKFASIREGYGCLGLSF